MEQPDLRNVNQTMVTFFLIKGFSDIPELEVPIFILVLLLYPLTLGGNVIILLLVCLDPRLRTPMYFFLANLSIIDMGFSTVTLHNIIFDGLGGEHIISILSYIIQLYFVAVFVSNQLLLLTAMSYDRYVAICNPLRYTLIMNYRMCALLAVICWMISLTEVLPYFVVIIGFTCYKSNIINHFFCDILPIIQLSCNDTFVLETWFLVEGTIIQGFFPFFLTFLSYVFIIKVILRFHSSAERCKAFSACSSHLTIVILLYTTLVYQYLKPISASSLKYNKLFSLFNTTAIPIINPLIYSLKNKDVKVAFKKRLFFRKLKHDVSLSMKPRSNNT